MTSLDIVWISLAAVLVLQMQIGFLLLEAGLSREKNATNVALKNVCDLSIVLLLFWAIGFGLMFGTVQGGLWGDGPRAPVFGGSDGLTGDTAAFFLFQAAFAATAATILSGAVAERVRFSAYLLLGAVLGGLVYPVVGHWAWGGALGGPPGWLAQMGFTDFAGAMVVHGTGGAAALAAVMVAGPRRGRFSAKGRLIAPSSVTLAAQGALWLWLCWAAFNAGSALHAGAEIAPIAVNTILAGAAGGVAALLGSQLRYGQPRPFLLIAGALAGLVGVTAAADLVDTRGAVQLGAGGGVAMLLVHALLEKLRIDDVVGAIPVHLGAGVWGTVGLVLVVPEAELPLGDRAAQLQVQVLGSLAIFGTVALAILAIAAPMHGLGRLRVRPRAEVIGLNAAEHGQATPLRALLDAFRGGDGGKPGADGAFGTLALRYSQVLDQAGRAASARIEALREAEEMHALAEEAFDALRRAQEESEHAARHDPLTGLGNRQLMEELCQVPLQKDMPAMLVVAIAIDRFQAITETHGEGAANRVLTGLAKTMKDDLRAGRDIAFRSGTDMFVMMREFEGSDWAAQFWCDALTDTLPPEIVLAEGSLRPELRVGHALARPGGALCKALRQAELALFEAKERDAPCVVAYSEDIGARHAEKAALSAAFRLALERDEIVVRFQPQVRASDHAVCGCEVLARWHHPERGPLGPDIFMPLAENLGLLGALDRRVLDQALSARAALRTEGFDLPEISVNVSARRLASPDLVEELRLRNDLPPKGLNFELLETAFLDSLSAPLEARIEALRRIGIGIEVDDFGTGHASFASVLALRPDRVKIDRLFVDGVDNDPDRRALIRTLVQMAERVGANTVVEGVETQSQAAALAEAGVDVLQGYAFGHPMMLDEFCEWLGDRPIVDGQAA